MSGTYVGEELDLFSDATNWKKYWRSVLLPYLGREILDVGAGIGSTARVFAGIECNSYVALEPDEHFTHRMTSDALNGGFPHGFEVMTGTSRNLPSERTFDTILYIDVLEHIADDREELQHVAGYLKPDGRIIVLSPAHQWLYSEFDKAIGHVRRYDRKSFLDVKPDGFEVERLVYLDSVGMLASLGNRLMLKASSPTAAQIALWDGWMVPVSRIVDKATFFAMGKSILGVLRKPGSLELTSASANT